VFETAVKPHRTENTSDGADTAWDKCYIAEPKRSEEILNEMDGDKYQGDDSGDV